jgi:predicted MFS family arabinose efflux permease
VTTAERRSSLWRLPAVRSLFAVNVLGFLSYSLLLSALPAHAAALGYGLTAAGSVTTVFLLATVLAQMTVPALVHRFGLGPVLLAGLLALGLPSPLYLLAEDVRWFAVVSVVRGFGFAVLTVLGATVAAQAAPSERRGESIGIYGLSIAVPTIAAVPGGAALTLAGHFGWVAALSAAPVFACAFLPGLVRAVGSRAEPGSGRGTDSRSAVRTAIPPSLVLLVVTLAGAGLFTFLPIERPDGSLAAVALLLFGLSSAVCRWQAGVLVDRLGARLLMPGAVAAGVLGLGLLALGLVTDGATGAGQVLAGALVLGVCYGSVQNLTLVLALARAGDGRTATVSAVWNACFDSGTAIGALLVGAVAAGVGLPITYLLTAALLAVVLPLAVALGRTALRPSAG